MNRVIFIIRQHEEIDPVTGGKHVHLDKFDVVRIENGYDMGKINDTPLKERGAERLRKKLYESLEPS